MARVLVIEDNPASMDLMLYLLKAFGHTAFFARDGLEGIEAARRERPDLVLCDIQLPGADGHEVCRQLKRDPALRKIALVAVTAYAMVGDREKLLGEGFDGYLSKPIDPQTFIDRLKPYIRSVSVRPASSVTTEITAPPDATEGTILVVDNSPANIQLSRSMLEPFGYKVIAAKGVDEAMKILGETKPDTILSDLHMPEKDGFDLIQEVKNDAQLSEIPFVFISSTVWGDRERTLALSLGADRFIIRPIEPEALIAEIESARCHSATVKTQEA